VLHAGERGEGVAAQRAEELAGGLTDPMIRLQADRQNSEPAPGDTPAQARPTATRKEIAMITRIMALTMLVMALTVLAAQFH
jgi:hypothetical protein